jgi:hypothetical protein
LIKHAKNKFQRRIIGLVSYYYGSTPDYFAKTIMHSVDPLMSDHQYSVYFEAQELEKKISIKMFQQGKKASLFKTYTRQASNFAFPPIYNGAKRPRSSDFRLTEREAQEIESNSGVKTMTNSTEYIGKLKFFMEKFKEYLIQKQEEDDSDGHTIYKDIDDCMNSNMTFQEYNEKKRSKLYKALYDSSCKYTNAIFNIIRSKGPGLVYANYVKMEGLELFKIYLSKFGIEKIIEFHSEVDIEERYRGMERLNAKENINGDKVKLILISAAGVEGLNLRNIRHVHILDPYWNETRITQVIGRAVRFCSHVDLPVDERVVDVYRYHSTRKGGFPLVDSYIENYAKKKRETENSFLDAVKEAAIDCVLYKNHNMINSKYKCFQFSENSLFDKYIGPAYRRNINEDNMFDNGSNSSKFHTLTIKVKKIKAVKIISIDPVRYSLPDNYLFHKKTSMVYDVDMHYPVGKIKLNENGDPEIYKENIYIIDKVIPIPIIENI